MLEAHGLSFLLHLVQLELAKQAAAQQGVKVTPDDVKQERKLTFQRMFKESDDALQRQAEGGAGQGRQRRRREDQGRS